MKWIFSLREPLSSASHLAGALAGVFGAVYLLSYCDQTWTSVLAILVYCIALITLFLVSGLFHGLHCSEETIEKLERLDYAAIYFFIAGTYTPICLFVIKGWLGTALLIGEWSLALVGAWTALSRGHRVRAGRACGQRERNTQVLIYLAMGWAFVFALPSLAKALSPMAFRFLLLGGLFYSVGAVIFALNRPSLFRDRCSAHDFWHLLVLLGSSAHFVAIAKVVA
jgi:hemolysin III